MISEEIVSDDRIISLMIDIDSRYLFVRSKMDRNITIRHDTVYSNINVLAQHFICEIGKQKANEILKKNNISEDSPIWKYM